ncbi:hypothetical protein [uncultured Fibrella sp.]|uniref:hypothetical protein n=1 Tax=uncultured Fibrella sp. TaxID=1284596 RepID=UPI0035CB7A3D
MKTVTYPAQPLPPANCHVTQMVYRTLKLPSQTEAKGVIVGQERLYIYTLKGLSTPKWPLNSDYHPLFIERTVTLRYDASNRLIEEITRPWDRPSDTISYSHEPTRILYTNSYWDSKRIIQRDTLPIDSRGLSRKDPRSYRYGYYDKDGFLAVGNFSEQDPQIRRIRQQVINGNLVELTDSLDYWGETHFRYLHYVDRPNVPTTTPFFGKQSRQLVAQQLWSLRLSPFYRDGDKYTTKYVYLFDVQGRVRRSISYGVPLDPGWPFELFTGGISVIDYSYSCP